MAAGLEAPGHLVGGQHGAHGQAVGQGLGHADGVRGQAVLLEGPEGTGTAQTGLHFVADEEDVVLAAQGLHTAQVIARQGHDAAFALHHFHQHRRRGGRDGGFQRGQVIGGHLLEASGQRRETVAQALAARSGQRTEGTAVEAAAQGDDLVGVALLDLAHVAAGQLDAGLVGLGAGIAEEGLAMMAGAQQQAGQLQLLFLIEEVADVPELVGLGFQGGADLVVAVAQGGHRNAGQQVHIFLTVHVPQPRALASDHSHGISAVGTAKQCFFLGFDGGKCVGHGQLLCWEALRHPTGHVPRQS